MDKKLILKNINNEFFEFPQSKLKSKIVSFLRTVVPCNVEFQKPNLIICNKTGRYDKLILSEIIKSDFVILSDSVIENIYNDTFSSSQMQELLKDFALLKQENISVAVFPEFNYTFFGACESLPTKITDFICETNYDITFLTLVGTFFNYPIWSNSPRISQINISKQFSITHNKLIDLNSSERNTAINNYMPSSASTYSARFPTFIKSNKIAENLESFIYACPKCKTLFSVYSEFNYLKCRECGSAMEFAHNGQILLSNTISSYDDFDSFLYNTLTNYNFSINPIVTYDSVKILEESKNKKLKENETAKLTIYPDKIEITSNTFSKSLSFFEIKNIKFLENNTIKIFHKSQDIIRGLNKENFYILLHLLKLNHS